MKNNEYFLGLDISTTSAKAIVMDGNGIVIAKANSPLLISTPYPLWCEQNPEDWWSGICNSIHNVLSTSSLKSSEIKAIGLTGQMHGLVLLGHQGNILRPAILWNDQRTAVQCDEIIDKVGRKRLIEITGNNALTGFTAPKILWVHEHEPEVFSKIEHILLPKDYVRYRLTGNFSVDKADGSGTILFDLRNRNWSTDLLEMFEIKQEWMPTTFEGSAITGYINSYAAGETGLVRGTPVIAGGGDQSAQAVGVGVVKPGIIALTLGTSGVVFAATSEPSIEKEGRLHAFCHAVPGQWHLMGVMLSAAGSLQWYHDWASPSLSFDAFLSEAENVVPGSEGLFFLPYLTGERTPYPDPYARAGWIGMTVRHTRGHLTRSVLEGVAYGLKDSFELMKTSGLGRIDQVRISGGGAQSKLWRTILASVLNEELVTVNTTEGAAFGAAILAGVGVGKWANVPEACADVVQITGTDTPRKEMVEIYEKGYKYYRALYPALKPTFDAYAGE